jgi:guanylate kinase
MIPGVEISISYTSRPPRSGEVDGVDYRFIPKEEFDRRIREGGFLEWAQVHGRFYGTGKKEVEDTLRRGVDLILVIDVQGGKKVLQELSGSVGVFLFPPSWEELERRLILRGLNSPEEIRIRMETARKEVREAMHYHYWILNDELDPAVKRFVSIIQAERLRRERWQNHPLALESSSPESLVNLTERRS